VAFSGRIIGPDEGKEGIAKYVNSPETPMYHKSSILYGYNFARHDISRSKKVLVVEGQMDVVMCHQAGNTNTVAISGTAFTPEHISILKRFAEKVLLAFDQDEAGEQAMKKCALLSLFGGLDAFVVPKKIGVKDTADLIKEYGGRAWEELLEKRQHIIEYLVANGLLKTKDERERNIRIIKKYTYQKIYRNNKFYFV
jgi:DNA primase